jgi:acetoin utilization deacetylase AcuC-like enzyme
MVAAIHALQHHGCRRVAIVDFDVHHGNGTEVGLHQLPPSRPPSPSPEDCMHKLPRELRDRIFFFSTHLYYSVTMSSLCNHSISSHQHDVS